MKPEKIRKGRSSALPVILKPGEKPNAMLQKVRKSYFKAAPCLQFPTWSTGYDDGEDCGFSKI